MPQNYFDQFDEPKSNGNFFDQFDEQPAQVDTRKATGIPEQLPFGAQNPYAGQPTERYSTRTGGLLELPVDMPDAQKRQMIERYDQSIVNKKYDEALMGAGATFNRVLHPPGILSMMKPVVSTNPELLKKQGAFVTGTADTVTLGFGDELSGVIGGDAAKQQVRYLQEASQARQPGYYAAGQFAGAAVPIGGPLKVGQVTKLGAGAKGILAGGAYGFGSGEGGALQRADEAAIGAAAGYAGGKITEGAFGVGREIAKRVGFGNVQTRVAQPGVAGASPDEFGITLTKGQLADDFTQRAWEDAASKGARGAEAQQILRPFMQEQRSAAITAGRTIAGDTFDDANQAGAAIKSAFDVEQQAAKKAVDDAYDVARSYGAQLNAEGVPALVRAVDNSIPDHIRKTLQASPTAASQIYPSTSVAMSSVKALADEVAALGDNVTSVDFQRVELLRRQLNGLANSVPKDRADDLAGVLAAKRGLEGFVDAAADEGLFNGGREFLDAYVKARGLRREFAEKFEANKVLQKFVNEDVNEREVVNYIFGSGKLVSKDKSVKVVQQLKDALGGPDSEGFQAVREAAVKRLMEPLERMGTDRLAAKTFADTWDEALTKSGAPIMKELFTPEELAKMGRLRDVVRKMVPPEGSVNTSATALEMARREIERAAGDILTRPFGYAGRMITRVVEGAKPDPNVARAQEAIRQGIAARTIPAPQGPVGNAFSRAGAIGAASQGIQTRNAFLPQ